MVLRKLCGACQSAKSKDEELQVISQRVSWTDEAVVLGWYVRRERRADHQKYVR